MSFAERDGWIWCDGDMIPWREAKVHFLTHTLHYGRGVFEGVRSHHTEKHGVCIFRLRDHIRRLLNSARILQMEVPCTAEVLEEAQREVVRKNGLGEFGYLRPMCLHGSEGMGLHADNLRTHVMIAAWEWPSYLAPEAREQGIRVHTASHIRHHAHRERCQAKASGSYIDSILASREAHAQGCDEALLLDQDGYVAEGSGENFFIVRDEILETPEPSWCLKGITRDTILTLAKEAGMTVRETHLSLEQVYTADEAFFTGTAAGLVPIQEVDGKAIGTGCRGAVTERLQTLYADQTHGRRSEHPEWLVPVEP